MDRIMVAGSMSITELSEKMKQSLIHGMESGAIFLVGDNPKGGDRLAQEFLASHDYHKVVVYFSVTLPERVEPRFLVDGFDAQEVESSKPSGRERHAVKDIRMVKDCDLGLFFWDGESKGTKGSIDRIKKMGKPYEVFMPDTKTDVYILTSPSVKKLLPRVVKRVDAALSKGFTVSGNKTVSELIDGVLCAGSKGAKYSLAIWSGDKETEEKITELRGLGVKVAVYRLPEVFEFGYKDREVQELVSLSKLKAAVVVDTRINPVSGNPDWNKASLEADLLDNWIFYRWVKQWGNKNYRGGKIQVKDFEGGLALLDIKEVSYPIILLCVCKDYKSCHRKVVMDMLAEYGFPINPPQEVKNLSFLLEDE